jgi:hypothetical protein
LELVASATVATVATAYNATDANAYNLASPADTCGKGGTDADAITDARAANHGTDLRRPRRAIHRRVP